MSDKPKIDAAAKPADQASTSQPAATPPAAPQPQATQPAAETAEPAKIRRNDDLVRKAICTISRPQGNVVAGTLFQAANKTQLEELEQLEAVAEPTDAEMALYREQQSKGGSTADELLG